MHGHISIPVIVIDCQVALSFSTAKYVRPWYNRIECYSFCLVCPLLLLNTIEEGGQMYREFKVVKGNFMDVSNRY